MEAFTARSFDSSSTHMAYPSDEWALRHQFSCDGFAAKRDGFIRKMCVHLFLDGCAYFFWLFGNACAFCSTSLINFVIRFSQHFLLLSRQLFYL